MLITTAKYLTPAAFLLLTACMTPGQQPVTATGQLNQICQNLKQEIIMDSTRNVPEEGGNNPTTQARLYKEYDKNHCDEVLRQKTLSRASTQPVVMAKR